MRGEMKETKKGENGKESAAGKRGKKISEVQHEMRSFMRHVSQFRNR